MIAEQPTCFDIYPLTGQLIPPSGIEDYGEIAKTTANFDITTKLLINKFLHSGQGYEVALTIREQALSSRLQWEDFSAEVAGHIFEHFAYNLLSWYQKPNYLLLSPDKVFQIFRRLYPENDYPTINNRTFGEGIRGISFPDILSIRKARRTYQISDIYECKLGTRFIKPNQMARFRHPHRLFGVGMGHNSDRAKLLGEILQEISPELDYAPVIVSPSTKVTWITPHDADPLFPKIEPAPISKGEFRQFMSAFLKDTILMSG